MAKMGEENEKTNVGCLGHYIPPELEKNRSWFMHYEYKKDKDSPSEARNVLLVVVTLIAAVTFQAGINPPGGIWQDEKDGHEAGRAIYAAQKIPFYVFLISNTIALSTSILVIISLTYKFPFHFEVLAATVSMLVTYGAAIFAVTPREPHKVRYVLIAATLPFVARGLLYFLYVYKGKGRGGGREKIADGEDKSNTQLKASKEEA